MKAVHGELQCSLPILINKEESETLEDFLDTKVFAGNQGSTLNPDPEGVEGFNMFMERYMKGLPIEQRSCGLQNLVSGLE